MMVNSLITCFLFWDNIYIIKILRIYILQKHIKFYCVVGYIYVSIKLYEDNFNVTSYLLTVKKSDDPCDFAYKIMDCFSNAVKDVCILKNYKSLPFVIILFFYLCSNNMILLSLTEQWIFLKKTYFFCSKDFEQSRVSGLKKIIYVILGQSKTRTFSSILHLKSS